MLLLRLIVRDSRDRHPGRATNRDPPAFTQADSSTTRKHGEPDWAAHPRQLVILMNRRIGNAFTVEIAMPDGLVLMDCVLPDSTDRTRRLEFAGDRRTARTPVGATPAKPMGRDREPIRVPSQMGPGGRRRPRLRPPICCHIASRRSTLSLASATAVSGRSSRNVRELWS